METLRVSAEAQNDLLKEEKKRERARGGRKCLEIEGGKVER